MTTITNGEAELLLALVAALRRHFSVDADRHDAVGEEIRNVEQRLARVTASPLPLQPTDHPLTRYLPAVLDLAERDAPDVATALRPLGSHLPWRYGYAPRADAPGLDGSMGWAEIVGPAAPLVSDDVCFGLTLIGPHAHYLPHRHPAVELYRIVVGHPHWTVDQTTSLRAPGDAILHSSDVVHAMRTEHEPLLAIYSWTGDVLSPSVWAE
jgi:hypothetical protein